MTPERWQRAKTIFASAIELDASQRVSYVQSVCGNDQDLFREVISLLEADSTETLLRNPLAGATTVQSLLKQRYRIERELGRGGLGVVYLAHDETLHGRPVVVKMPIDPTPRDPWLAEKFALEVKALALIDHPGVVGALDSGVAADGRPFMVIQYVDGRPLKEAMTKEGVPLEFAARVLREIGEALGAAHARGIWHRDLKPPNIMLQRLDGGRELVRLIDFGIASIQEAPMADSGGGEIATRVAGTPLYMAPEQFEGRVSAASDIFSMGVVAYEMVTGRKPFTGTNEREQYDLLRAGNPLRPSQLRPGVPERAERLMLQALSFLPKDRPANAADFGEQLAEALTAAPAAPPAPPSAKRRNAIAAVIGVAIMAAGGSALGVWWNASHGAKIASPVGGTAATPVAAPEQDSVAWSMMVEPGKRGPGSAATPGLPLKVTDAFYLVFRAPGGFLYLLSDDTGKDSLSMLGAPQIRPGEPNRFPHGSHFLFDGPSVMDLWCAWSREEMPELESLRKLLNEKDRGIVADAAERIRTRQFLAALPQPQPSTPAGGTETVLTGSRRMAWKVRVEAK